MLLVPCKAPWVGGVSSDPDNSSQGTTYISPVPTVSQEDLTGKGLVGVVL